MSKCRMPAVYWAATLHTDTTKPLFVNESRCSLFLQHETSIWLTESCCMVNSHAYTTHKTIHYDDFMDVFSLERHDYLISLYPIALKVYACVYVLWGWGAERSMWVCMCMHAQVCKCPSGLFGNYIHFSYSKELSIRNKHWWSYRIRDDSGIKR